MSIIETLLDDADVDPDDVAGENTRNRANQTVSRDHAIDLGEIPPPTEFPNNPFLDDAQTDSGGLFANLGGGDVVALEEGTKMSEFPTGDGEPFGLDGQFMQPVYVNTTDESISIEVDSIGFGPTLQALGVDPYNETEFGVDDQWYRIPTGIGTPYPISGTETAWDEDGNFEGKPIAGDPDGDYELVEISETDDGFKVVWEFLSEFVGDSFQTEGEVIQPPEEDAELLW